MQGDGFTREDIQINAPEHIQFDAALIVQDEGLGDAFQADHRRVIVVHGVHHRHVCNTEETSNCV